MADREYHRLTFFRRRPGIAIISVSRASLWLGKDHLLYIETTGYTESYKRFYFRDIQSITFSGTSVRLAWTIAFSMLGALLLLIGISSASTSALITFCVFALFLAVVPLLINLALGPTCKGEIRTRVQTEFLPITRVKKAHKILARIRPLIADAQGQLSSAEISTRMLEMAGANFNPAPAPITQPLRPADESNLPPQMGS